MTPDAPRHGFLGLTYRQLIAIVALVNALVATYLHLWKLGLAGALAFIEVVEAAAGAREEMPGERVLGVRGDEGVRV